MLFFVSMSPFLDSMAELKIRIVGNPALAADLEGSVRGTIRKESSQFDVDHLQSRPHDMRRKFPQMLKAILRQSERVSEAFLQDAIKPKHRLASYAHSHR